MKCKDFMGIADQSRASGGEANLATARAIKKGNACTILKTLNLKANCRLAASQNLSSARKAAGLLNREE